MKQTHKSITDLLRLDGAVFLFLDPVGGDESYESAKDLVIKTIVGAVSPIIPLTIKNKSLDGFYIRTALLLLEATELMFSQYKENIRSQANPVGLLGMCNAMHAEIKSIQVHSTEMKSVSGFMKDMKIEFNTSLSLGEPFRNDITPRDKRRGKGGRSSCGRAWRVGGSGPSDL